MRHSGKGSRELGYVEGKNITIEWRFAEANPDRLRTFAAELVRLPVEIIVTAGPASNRVAKQATATIPIVMGFDDDPVDWDTLPALLGTVGTSLDCPRLRRRSPENKWSF